LSALKFGCQLPQDTSDVNRIFEVTRQCEDLGFDSVWTYDHLAPYWLHPPTSLESWTLLAAIAARTSKIRIGSLVTNVNFRNPAFLAKMASTVDNISGGRLIVGLGAGDRMSANELRAHGYRFPGLNERILRLRETIMILRGLWAGEEMSFRGSIFNVSKAICLPTPIQSQGLPIWVGGRHRKVVEVAAELADGWNCWGITGERLTEMERHLVVKCQLLERDPRTIIKSWAGTLRSSSSKSPKIMESMKAELMSHISKETDYVIGSFPASSDRKTYEAFADAVRCLS